MCLARLCEYKAKISAFKGLTHLQAKQAINQVLWEPGKEVTKFECGERDHRNPLQGITAKS